MAASAEAAADALEEFERGPWGQKYPTVVTSWRRAWYRVIPFFAFALAVRRVVYTNAMESVHSRLRKIIKTRGHFPSDDAATELIWLALRNITTDLPPPRHISTLPRAADRLGEMSYRYRPGCRHSPKAHRRFLLGRKPVLVDSRFGAAWSPTS